VPSETFRDKLMIFTLATFLLLAGQAAPGTPAPPAPLEKSAYFAFVGRDFMFTVELVRAGVPLLNFVSMVDSSYQLSANEVRLTIDTRKVPAKFFMVDTGNPKEPLIVPSLTVRPRSAFGVRLQGDFEGAKDINGAAVRLGDEDFKLAPLTSFDFENLVLKINRLNLDSPDFADDWRVLKLELIGSREKAKRRSR
jgi:hypothetical protein